jgi:hypothetical protein
MYQYQKLLQYCVISVGITLNKIVRNEDAISTREHTEQRAVGGV